MDPLSPLASTLLVLSPFVTLGYAGLCWLWPYKACRSCGGEGRFYGPWRGIRLCRRCAGTGYRLRFGRRVWNQLGRLYRDINRYRDDR